MRDLYRYYHEVAGQNGPRPDPQMPNETVTCSRRIFRFLEIDRQSLSRQSILYVIVFLILMVIRKILKMIKNLIVAIWRYIKANAVNAWELLNMIFTSIVVYSIGMIFLVIYSDKMSVGNSSLLEEVNMVAARTAQIKIYLALSVFCLCFRMLELLRFSILAYLPVQTLLEGKQGI